MGRNRRQQRLRDRRAAPQSQAPAAGRGAGAGGRGAGAGGGPPRRPKPAWRETLDSFGGFTVVGAIVGSLLIVALLVWLNRPGSSASDDPYEPRAHEQVDGRVAGNPDAPVRIIEYADFQCPFCKRFWDETEPALMEEYIEPGLVSFEYRDYAFISGESVNAAAGARCAADQGFFWHLHDLLFLRQGNERSGVYADGNMHDYAEELGEHFAEFDVDAWKQCYDAGTYVAEVEQSTQQAQGQGLTSTPTFVINGQVLAGAQPIEQFRTILDAMLEGETATPTGADAPATTSTPEATLEATAEATDAPGATPTPAAGG